MRRFTPSLLLCVVLMAAATSNRQGGSCGTGRETAAEQLFLHRQSIRRHAALQPRTATTPTPDIDMGDVAIIHDQNGIVERQNEFNLNGYSLTFQPASGSSYRYSVAQGGYDSTAAAQATPLAALDDDDSREVALPFAFPFYGATYRSVFVNSDGNLTFGAGDSASTQRSLSRMTAGAPRIAPLFDDLNPSLTAGGVRVLSSATRVVVSWVQVPEYSDTGSGALETFQVQVFPDGRIQFAWSAVAPTQAVVGISPGNLQGQTAIVDYRNDATGTYAASLAEVFTEQLTIDAVLVAQQFFQTHDDSYDYLAIYNDMAIPASGEGTVAYEQTARNVAGSGYGVAAFDSGQQFGSASRLQSVLNMGPLSQYPADPTALVPARAPQGDTPLSVLAHEAGHLFLAYASVRDPGNPSSLPMLGYQQAHWSFLFDSEASMMEGERIADRGASTQPEFLTTDTVQQYSPLDQYLMGFRAAFDVPDVFYVGSPSPNYLPTLHPFSGIGFNGTRQNVTAAAVEASMGPRIPGSTLAQRRFRFAFILLEAAGTQPSAASLTQIETYRQQFQAYYAKAASANATADATLRRSLKLSLFPWSGVAAGASLSATISVQTAPAQGLTIQLSAPNGFASLPSTVTLPAGATSVSFTVGGVRAGVEEVQATPADAAYETAFARVQVADAAVLQLKTVSPAAQLSGVAPAGTVPVTVRLTDANNLSYAGVLLDAAPSANGAVFPASVTTDSSGLATFGWLPGPASTSQLRVFVAAMPSVSVSVNTGSGVPVITSVVNAASLAAGLSPGAWGAVLGSHLTGSSVLLNGQALLTSAISDSAVDFFLPLSVATGPATLTVTSSAGYSDTRQLTLLLASPGIFAVRHNGADASSTPVKAGDALEIYCTGLGPIETASTNQVTQAAPVVFVGAVPVTPFFSGLAPGLTGVYQVNMIVPTGLQPGPQPLLMSVDLAHSNTVTILVQ